MDRDAEHLRLLSLFFYIRGGICAVFSCFFILYIFVGGLFAVVSAVARNHNGPPPEIGLFFSVLGFVLVLVGWSLAAVAIYTGRCIALRRDRVFCMIVAGFNCIFIPYGTILGVFTIIVLERPSVQKLFDQRFAP